MSDGKTKKSKKSLVIRLVLGIVGLGLLVSWSGGCFKSKLEPGKIASASGAPLPQDAATFVVQSELLHPRIDVVGTVVSEEIIHLSSRVPAYIHEVHASAGDHVTKGQVLVALDDRELREQLVAAKAHLQQAQTEYERTKKLIEANATTDQALTATESAYNAALSQVKQIEVMLTYTIIKSPIDGIVTDRRVEVGDLANPGQVLLAVYDPSRMRIEVPVPIRLISKFKLAQDVDVELEHPDQILKGTVTEIVGEVDSKSRTQRVKVHLNKAGESILPGVFGRVWVADDAEKGMLVPKTAVYQIGQLEIVEVVDGDRMVKRMVKTGPVYDDKVEILSGLKSGDRILVQPTKG